MKNATVLLMVLITSLLQAQQPGLSLLPGDFSSFSIDNLGHLYVVTAKDMRLVKYNPKGDSMGVFNDVKRYGRLTTVNAANPLRTLLFYKDYRTIVVLDRFLNPVNNIDLRKSGLFQVRAIAPSYDNNVWIFDEQESKLKKISETGKLLSETADLRVALDDAPLPQQLVDQNGFIYLYDPQKGLFTFDYYGALKGKVALLGWTDVQVIGETIMGIKEGKLQRYQMGTLDLRETTLPVTLEAFRAIQLTPSGIFLLNEKGISRFSY